MKKENYSAVREAIKAAEARKAAAEKAVLDNAEELHNATIAAEAALEAEDLKAFQDANAKKAMCEFKDKKLQAASSSSNISPEEYNRLNEAIVKEYTDMHRSAYKRLLALAEDMKEISTELEAKRAEATDLSNRLNSIHSPESAFMLSFNIPYLTAARNIDNMITDLNRGVKE